MAGEKQEEAKRRLAELGAMTLDEVAAFAAANPDSVYAQVAQIEIRRRVLKPKSTQPTHYDTPHVPRPPQWAASCRSD